LRIKHGYLAQIMDKYEKDVTLENRKVFRLEDSGKVPLSARKERHRSAILSESESVKARLRLKPEVATYDTDTFFAWAETISPEVVEKFKQAAVTNGETLHAIYEIEGKQGLKELGLKPGHLIYVLKKLIL